jgi:ATP-dependent Clp protease adaptor protein ClpS
MPKQEANVSEQKSAVAEPEVEEQTDRKAKRKPPKRQPRYNVILWNDDDHTYDYVIKMLKELFGHEEEQGMLIATEVDKTGRGICLTTTMEHAELKRDQIHAYGGEKGNPKSKGSMSATIEPVPGQ